MAPSDGGIDAPGSRAIHQLARETSRVKAVFGRTCRHARRRRREHPGHTVLQVSAPEITRDAASYQETQETLLVRRLRIDRQLSGDGRRCSIRRRRRRPQTEEECVGQGQGQLCELHTVMYTLGSNRVQLCSQLRLRLQYAKLKVDHGWVRTAHRSTSTMPPH